MASYKESFEELKKLAEKIDVSSVEGHFAYQCDIIGGDDEGIFYVEIADGKVNAQPYDYRDNDAILEGTKADFGAFFNGNVSAVKTISGDASVIANAVKKTAEKNVKATATTTSKATTAATSTAATKAAAPKKPATTHPVGHKKPTKKERENLKRK